MEIKDAVLLGIGIAVGVPFAVVWLLALAMIVKVGWDMLKE